MGGGRIESRNADASCNPYLAATLMLAAGLQGIKEKLNPGDAQEENLYEFTPEQLAARGISELPRSLDEAVAAFASDPFVEEVLGSTLREEFIRYKSEEWRQYHQRVTDWEIDQYARRF
jgi:glutamine synthetase